MNKIKDLVHDNQEMVVITLVILIVGLLTWVIHEDNTNKVRWMKACQTKCRPHIALEYSDGQCVCDLSKELR